MSDSKCSPVQKVVQACGASREEIKVQREVFAVAVDTTDRLDGVLEKFELSKGICAWISRCLHNSHRPDQKLSSPLTTKRNKEATYFLGKKSAKEL